MQPGGYHHPYGQPYGSYAANQNQQNNNMNMAPNNQAAPPLAPPTAYYPNMPQQQQQQQFVPHPPPPVSSYPPPQYPQSQAAPSPPLPPVYSSAPPPLPPAPHHHQPPPTANYQPNVPVGGMSSAHSPQYPPQPRSYSNPSNLPPAPKINAAHMPNVVAVYEEDLQKHSYFRTSMLTDSPPPLPSTLSQIPVIDDGNCSPRFIRPTTYNIPISEDMANQAKIPVSLVLQPFASQCHSQEIPVPTVDFGVNGPIRCSRCKAYINVFVKFIKGGRQFECNICGMQNDVPNDYFCNLDASGRRADFAQRPELSLASVDFLASKEYITRTPSSPFLLLAIETSRNSIQNGAFAASLQSIRRLLDLFIKHPEKRCYAKFALITFDRTISVYDLRTEDPQVLVMCDTQDPFVPIHDGLFFDPIQNADRLYSLLDRLPSMFSESRIVDSCLGAAVLFAIDALKEHGGRVALFATSLPSYGAGILRTRTQSTVQSEKPDPSLLPQIDFYSKCGIDAAAKGISFVIVSTPVMSTDLASIGQLAKQTNGYILHYPKFGYDFNGHALVEELLQLLSKPIMFDCLLRVRAGSLLQTGEYIGNFADQSLSDYQFAAFDSDQTFAINFLYDGKLSEGEIVTIQCAILYTSADGIRKIRIHNIALKATSTIANVFRMADLDSIIQLYCKRAVSQLKSMSLQAIISHFTVRSAQILAAYRKHCAQNMPSGQLVLPESLKLLPLYCLAFIKNLFVSAGIQSSDCRVSLAHDVMSISFNRLPALLYPRLFPLHRLIDDQQSLPTPVRLSQEFIEHHGLYALENGRRILIWISNMVDPETLSLIFGVAQPVALQTSSLDSIPYLNNPLSAQACKSIRYIQEIYEKYIPIKVIRQSLDPAEIDWQHSLIEDSHPALGPSYVDFLCRLHGQINHELTSSSLAEKTALLSFLQ